MEGSPDDIKASSEKKDDKKAKKSETAFGLGKSTFEFTSKKAKAEKIAEAPLWEKLIPKDGGEKVDDRSVETGVEAADDTAEEASDPAVENLSQSEKAEVVADYAQEKKAELEAGRSETEDPVAAAEREADIRFLENLEQEAGATPVERIEAAAEAVPETAQEEVVEADVEAESPQQAGPAEFEHGQEIPLNAPEQPEDTEDEPIQPAAAAAATPLSQPPAPPGSPGNTGGVNFNAMPTPVANPDVVPASTHVEYVRDRRNEGTYFLAGGILGYLLGRRRGRIKTEKRMNAVKQKLERQIDQVRQEVARQETVIRQQARERYNLTHTQTQERIATPQGAETTAARTVNPGQGTETAPRLTKADVVANQRQAAERLGITTAEASATAERIQYFDHQEVLAIAEKISLDGTSLRTIYESKQITEPGLRRITREFLRGGDVKAALQAEIQVKEMQYERDPQMRDRLAASYAGVDAAQPQASSEAMATLVAHATDPARSPMRDSAEANEAAVQAAKERGRKALISAWIVLVVVLVITAVILAVR
jgi:hypothetical protein